MHPRLARLAMHLRPRTWIPLSAPRRDAWALVCTVSPGNGLDSFLPVRHYRERRLTVKETTLSPRLPDACLYKTVPAHSYQPAEIPFRVMTTDFTCPGLERLTRVIAVGMREQCARSRRPVRSLPSRGGRGGASARLECAADDTRLATEQPRSSQSSLELGGDHAGLVVLGIAGAEDVQRWGGPRVRRASPGSVGAYGSDLPTAPAATG